MNQGPQWWKSIVIALLAIGAAYALAYPSDVFPPDDPSRSGLMHSRAFHIALGVAIPLILMEALAWFAKPRNPTWFAGLSIAWILIYLSLPILYIIAPEYVFPTHGEEDMMMGRALGLLTLFIAISAFARLIVLPLMVPRYAAVSPADAQPIGSIAPAVGKTVRTIIDEHPKAQPRFLFGMSDKELVDRWGMLAQAMLTMGRTQTRRTISLLVVMALWPLAFWFGSGGAEGAMHRDIVRLREYTYAPGGRKIATDRAVHAAMRLFNEADYNQLLTGKTRQEIARLLELDRMDPGYREQVLSPRLEENASRERYLTIDDGKKSSMLDLNWDINSARRDRIENLPAAWSLIPVYLERERYEPKVWNAISNESGWEPRKPVIPEFKW